MDLNLNQLRAFFYASKYRSISIAAEKLFISQPAASMKIKALEDQYGVLLFVRKKGGLELTEAGRKLFGIADRIFELVEEATTFLDRDRAAPAGVLRIGSTKTLVRYLLTEYISKFRESKPRVQIQIDEGSSERMISSVLEGRNDFAIVGRLPYPDMLKVIPFSQDEVVLLVAPGHRLAGLGKVSIQELSAENLILREKGSGTRQVVEEAFQKAGGTRKVYIETGNVDFIKELVRQGKGITLLARMGVDPDLSSGRLVAVPLLEGGLMLDIDVIINRERRLSRADQAFLQVLLEKSVDRVKGHSRLPEDPSRTYMPA